MRPWTSYSHSGVWYNSKGIGSNSTTGRLNENASVSTNDGPDVSSDLSGRPFARPQSSGSASAMGSLVHPGERTPSTRSPNPGMTRLPHTSGKCANGSAAKPQPLSPGAMSIAAIGCLPTSTNLQRTTRAIPLPTPEKPRSPDYTHTSASSEHERIVMLSNPEKAFLLRSYGVLSSLYCRRYELVCPVTFQ